VIYGIVVAQSLGKEEVCEIMLEGKAVIEDTDMPLKMQIQAMASASEALDLYDVLDCTSIATHIKKVTFSPIFFPCFTTQH